MPNLKLGPQPHGTALVMICIRNPTAAAHLVARYGDLPEKTARGGKARGLLVYRIPPGCLRCDSNLIDRYGVLVDHAGEVKHYDGTAPAELPAGWLSWLVTAGAELDYRPSRADVELEARLRKLAREVTQP
jgi:hypothetical protein